jgi:hypothetical protein
MRITMLHDILDLALDPNAHSELRSRIAAFIRTIEVSADHNDRQRVARMEKQIADDPEATIRFDAQGFATVSAAGESWAAGRFTTPSLAELKQRTQAGQERIRLCVLDGGGPMTDIGSLQATHEDAVFQVASQFNCLESPGAFVTPVARYFADSTQGPRASISAFPATFVRHYAATDDHGRFVQQTNGQQIDLLADVFAPHQSPVRNGYLEQGLPTEPLSATLVRGFERIRVGVHEAAPVVFGYNWDGAVDGDKRITQVLTSTLAGGGYSAEDNLGVEFAPACQQLLRGAYLGTLLTAVSQGRSLVVLTLIGGGVFGNPLALIWDAICFAVDEVRGCVTRPLDVVVNGRDLSMRMELEGIVANVKQRGGTIVQVNPRGLVQVW